MVPRMTAKEWSHQVAVVAVDELVDHGIVAKKDVERAIEVAGQDRLTIGDYPPPVERKADSPRSS
jgi:hypothetical protein